MTPSGRAVWEGLLVQPSVASSITSERTMSTASANIANGSAWAPFECSGDRSPMSSSGLGTGP